MRIAIIQSCYIPWKGFFDLIGRCDEYVIYDSAQYVKRHWHNRNRIKTTNGSSWLTIPVVTKGRYDQAIQDVEIEKPWAEQHWRAIEIAYRKAPHFEAYAPTVSAWFAQAATMSHLSSINILMLRGLAEIFGLTTRFVNDSAYAATSTKSERLIQICQLAGATHYLSGPSARDYLDQSLFSQAGIAVEWMNYDGYPEYPQLHGPFDHAVSMLDLLFNVGPRDRSKWSTMV